MGYIRIKNKEGFGDIVFAVYGTQWEFHPDQMAEIQFHEQYHKKEDFLPWTFGTSSKIGVNVFRWYETKNEIIEIAQNKYIEYIKSVYF